MRTKRGLRYATSYDFGSNISFERENKIRIWAISLSTDKVSVDITLSGTVAFRNLHQSKIQSKIPFESINSMIEWILPRNVSKTRLISRE